MSIMLRFSRKRKLQWNGSSKNGKGHQMKFFDMHAKLKNIDIS